MLKDSIRVGLSEIADIMNNYGFSNEALVMMRKSYNECVTRED